jgi:hypothetical protein
MMIDCKKHGPSSGCHVSPDLAQKIASGCAISQNDYVRIDYEYLGSVAYRFYLGREIAAQMGFLKSERLPLSEYDEHPEKTQDVRPECSKCFRESLVDAP